MSNILSAFFIGVFVMGILMDIQNTKTLSNYKRAIQECEKSLPRDKHCKVIGVVDDGQR